MTDTFDIAVVGGGLTGLTAAHHAALDGFSVVHFIGSGVPGGLVANVGELEGFPAAGPVSALDVALRLTEENDRLGVKLVAEDVERLELAGVEKRLHASSDVEAARSVIAASGARLRMLDVPGAARLVDKGVSQCAWCDGSLYRGAEAVVVGCGDSALQEALHLAGYASRVTIISRAADSRAQRSLVDRATQNERIDFRWKTDVAEILGDDSVRGIRLVDQTTGRDEEVACAAVFVYVGLTPNTSWLTGQVTLDQSGHIVTNAEFQSSIPEVYAAGAVRSGYLGRLVHAVGEAASASMAAARHLRA